MNSGWLGHFQGETGKLSAMSNHLARIVIKLKFPFQISKHLDGLIQNLQLERYCQKAMGMRSCNLPESCLVPASCFGISCAA